MSTHDTKDRTRARKMEPTTKLDEVLADLDVALRSLQELIGELRTARMSRRNGGQR